jgi:ATP-dependent Lon protease
MFENLHAHPGFEDEAELFPMLPMEEEDESQVTDTYPDQLPILALKNTVLFPSVVIPITVGRDKSIKAINAAYAADRVIGVLSQRDLNVEDPAADDLFEVGTVARIIKLLKMPDGTLTAILQGRRRFRLREMISEDPYMIGTLELIPKRPVEESIEFEALVSSIRDQAQRIVELSPNIPSEANVVLGSIDNPGFLLNFIASNLNADLETKQQLLEIENLEQKADILLRQLNAELQILELKDQIENRVRGDIEKQQRDYFLNQQLKTIQEELGQNPHEEEINKLQQRAAEKDWPEIAAKTFEREISRLQRMNPQVAEYSVQLSYLELLLDLPWHEYTEDNFDLQHVQHVLDDDHYGLEKVKDRIIEHLAVLKLKGDMKAPILCLVGPPGVGKTSLGRSIASALGRKFVRMSLGGLHDESEIRGHRKTYIGAMPGRILQSLKKVGSSNPVFILDEIDKLGSDFRGDPSSALLEVLDPEQNNTFHDNYLDLEYDLSKVLFVATANSLTPIQSALRDRMEIIRVDGYSLEEKLEIAKRHLIPKQRKAHGLKAKQVRIPLKVIAAVVAGYTRESGVRSLDRRIAGLMRHAAKQIAMNEAEKVSISVKELPEILGPQPFASERYQRPEVAGVAVGLAWTEVGGDILFVEASLSTGKGKLTLTGNLGDVMKESAHTALSWIKAHAKALGIDPERFDKTDIHLHVPEGAIPKDGPSAGITMLTALVSVFKGQSVKPYLAMTGEITMRGKVLPVGGIKEKVLAAKRSGMKDILMCKENEKHVAEIKPDYLSGLRFHYVERMEEVLEFALG